MSNVAWANAKTLPWIISTTYAEAANATVQMSEEDRLLGVLHGTVSSSTNGLVHMWWNTQQVLLHAEINHPYDSSSVLLEAHKHASSAAACMS